MFKQFLGGSKLAKLAGVALTAGVVAAAFHTTAPVKASDHDDGETNIKARNLNLTDLYAFREDWQTGNHAAPDNTRMVFIMNTNPRSLARQQYFFNTNAVYSFFVSRRASKDAAVSGVPDMSFDFNFGQPSDLGAQSITLNLRRFTNGVETGTAETFSVGSTNAPKLLAGLTNNPAGVTVNAVGNNAITVFAGLREDPFFFDVDSFFRTRAAIQPGINGGYAPPNVPVTRGDALIPNATDQNSIDFAKGYNVNAIVMRVPINLLKDNTNNAVFDVWETISVPDSFAALR